MTLEPHQLYHIYNQGNRRQQIFFSREDYLSFLRLVRKNISPYCEILCYCLMPNHYHFIVQTDVNSLTPKQVGNITSTNLANGFRMLQSSYARLVNNKQNEFGSLFKQKTQAKLIDDNSNYLTEVFHYIHQNPVTSSLVKEMTDWEFSSYRDFAGLRNGTLTNIELALQLLDMHQRDFESESKLKVRDEVIKKYFSY